MEPKQSKPKTKGSPKKKGRNPWSDSEDDGSFSSGSDFDQSPPEKSYSRQDHCKTFCWSLPNIKFNFDENSSSDEEMELKDNEAVLNGDDIKQEIDDDLDDGDFHSENNVPSDSEDEKPKKKAGGGRKKKPGSDGESEPKKPKERNAVVAPAKPKPKKKKGSDSDSEEDDFAPKKTKSKAAPKAKKVTSTATSENDSDSDFGMKQPPSRAVEEDRDALFDSLLMSEPVKKTTVDTYSTEPDSPVKKSKTCP
ncbi:nucleolin 1-like [Homalodisca vitripennis]|uniref:nucleolin 1-like n=1 Tax=Homalodisca vitripennis TaxID=197043 RepID=UPI001EEAB436|nr:nucleolin 1-like [Homalodisca vitripennis]